MFLVFIFLFKSKSCISECSWRPIFALTLEKPSGAGARNCLTRCHSGSKSSVRIIRNKNFFHPPCMNVCMLVYVSKRRKQVCNFLKRRGKNRKEITSRGKGRTLRVQEDQATCDKSPWIAKHSRFRHKAEEKCRNGVRSWQHLSF